MVNKEEIRKALDNFEEDKFMDSKDILSKEIKAAKNDFLEKKLELKGTINNKED